MSTPLMIHQNAIISNDRDSVVQTDLTGSTVYSLPKWTAKRNMVDVVLMIMDEDGPMPMSNMRPTKKTRNAADQFYDVHQGEYEARGQSPCDQITRVHTHNNAFPKMYDELDKRRSIAQVGMTGLDIRQTALHGTAALNQNIMTAKFDPNCPKCIKRKKRMQDERRRKGLCRKCRNQLDRKEYYNNKNKLDRVEKNKVEKPKNQHSRHPSTSKVPKRSRVGLNKCFQCCLTAESKSVSTFKSNDNLLHVEITPPKLTASINIRDNHDKIVLKSKSSHKKRVAKKTASSKSDVNSGNPDTETGPSVSSYNSFLSTEHEPMIE